MRDPGDHSSVCCDSLDTFARRVKMALVQDMLCDKIGDDLPAPLSFSPSVTPLEQVVATNAYFGAFHPKPEYVGPVPPSPLYDDTRLLREEARGQKVAPLFPSAPFFL